MGRLCRMRTSADPKAAGPDHEPARFAGRFGRSSEGLLEAESELPGHRRAARVALVAADVHRRDPRESERDVGERAAGKGRETVADLVDVNPVSDLDRART